MPHEHDTNITEHATVSSLEKDLGHVPIVNGQESSYTSNVSDPIPVKSSTQNETLPISSVLMAAKTHSTYRSQSSNTSQDSC